MLESCCPLQLVTRHLSVLRAMDRLALMGIAASEGAPRPGVSHRIFLSTSE